MSLRIKIHMVIYHTMQIDISVYFISKMFCGLFIIREWHNMERFPHYWSFVRLPTRPVMWSFGVSSLYQPQTEPQRWRHQMETFSALLAICAGNSPVPGEFPTQRPVTRSFDVYFDLRPDKRLSKKSWGWWSWWFETLSHTLWRHRNECRELDTPQWSSSLVANYKKSQL